MALTIGLGIFLIANALLNDICATINSVNDNAKFDGNRIQLMEQFSDFIETHSSLLELSAFGFHLFLILFEFNSDIFFKCAFQTILWTYQCN